MPAGAIGTQENNPFAYHIYIFFGNRIYVYYMTGRVVATCDPKTKNRERAKKKKKKK